MAPPKAVKKPTPDAIALTQLGSLGLAPADTQTINGLDGNHDRYLDAAEIGRGLLTSAAPVVGRLFATGITHPRLSRGVVTSFKNLNPSQQFALLQKLSSPVQAKLLDALSREAPTSDLHYIWYQFVMAESGVLGGILLNHLQAMGSSLADRLPKAAEAAAGGTELRGQLQDHLKVAQSVRDHAASSLSYFPSADEARQFLHSRGVTIANGKTALPPALATVSPHIRGPFPHGATAVIHEGRGFIRIPKTHFFPKEYEVEVARNPAAAVLRKRYRAGQQLLSEDRYEDAIRFFEAILADHPQEVRATFEIGVVHIDLFNKTHDQTTLRRAITCYETAAAQWQDRLAKDPHYFDTHKTEGVFFEGIQLDLSFLRNSLVGTSAN